GGGVASGQRGQVLDGEAGEGFGHVDVLLRQRHRDGLQARVVVVTPGGVLRWTRIRGGPVDVPQVADGVLVPQAREAVHRRVCATVVVGHDVSSSGCFGGGSSGKPLVVVPLGPAPLVVVAPLAPPIEEPLELVVSLDAASEALPAGASIPPPEQPAASRSSTGGVNKVRVRCIEKGPPLGTGRMLRSGPTNGVKDR